ncbi:MAG: Na+/H+ antiporter subunit E [Phycisphaerae bacterium]|nr:Na+/H+ antiporter subunit E [Phycisphaerae bacterium]
MRQILCILVTFAIWVLLTWPPREVDLLAGLFFAILVATLFSELYPDQPHTAFDPRRWFWALVYLPYFLAHCIYANLDVAYRVLHVDLPIRPGIVRVPTTLQSDWAKTFLAASITLTPGTLVVDLDQQDLYVHWINVADKDRAEQTRQIAAKFEPLLRRIFE